MTGGLVLGVKIDAQKQAKQYVKQAKQ